MPYFSVPIDEHGHPTGPVRRSEHPVGGNCVELHVPAGHGLPPEAVAKAIRDLADHIPAAD